MRAQSLFASIAHQALCPRNFPYKNTRVGCHVLLQGIFLTQGSSSGLLCCKRSPALQADFFFLLNEPPGKLCLHWNPQIMRTDLLVLCPALTSVGLRWNKNIQQPFLHTFIFYMPPQLCPSEGSTRLYWFLPKFRGPNGSHFQGQFSF